jgi:methylmalonyl-CoA mutase C-terminal domain/subunit
MAKRRLLIGKAGLDGHDRGAKVIARALRDAGMEVIYTGLHQTPQSIIRSAIDEDVDAIGISILSGAHMTIFPKLLDLLKKEKSDDIILFGGGIVPDEDIKELKNLGVKEIFTPGSSMQSVVEWIEKNVPIRHLGGTAGI